ncbi:MAG: MoxR family ATPase [Sedimentisphaerales bacterium]|nr:MoxR family ATPase [Sedimentisphaerales bacterium]
MDTYQSEQRIVEQITAARGRMASQLAKVIVGQRDVVEQLFIAVLAGGHCLITGAPGLAKTLVVRSLAQLFNLRFQRIQFTPDLMPSDIIGTEILQQTDHQRQMVFVKGPIFANIILADEINRTPPKTQAALLEAMQEHSITVAGISYRLDEPFLVFATQNPIEMEGTYPLPEAQLDRFMFNIWIDYLPEDQEVAVVGKTTADQPKSIEPIFNAQDLLAFHAVVRTVPIAQDVIRYAVRLARASRPGPDNPIDLVNQYVRWGAGLRASQYMVLGAKARALLQGRPYVGFEDIRALAHPVLRHRILLNYRAEAEGLGVEGLIDRLLDVVGQ